MEAFLQLKSNETVNKAETSKVSKKAKTIPWIEKYRPRTVADIVEQHEVISVLEQCISGADLPNLLFYGPPGTGKTSTILAAARQLFGDMYKDRILELNASDERGIQVIRDKVKNFAHLTASGIRKDGKMCPSYKIIILDEADSMTHAAQAALRRTMEKETKSTRFCLICNYVSKIIEPLTSRCTKFRFKPLNDSMIYKRLAYICNQEGIGYDESALKVLVRNSGGDMRRAITCLQSCTKLRGQKGVIDEHTVFEVTGVVPKFWLDDLLTLCKILHHSSQLQDFINKFMLEAYSVSQVLEQLNETIISSEVLSDNQKAFIGEKIGVVGYRLQDGGSEYIQLLDLGMSIIKAFTFQ